MPVNERTGQGTMEQVWFCIEWRDERSSDTSPTAMMRLVDF